MPGEPTGIPGSRLAGGNIPLTRAEKGDNLKLFLYHGEMKEGKDRQTVEPREE
jgi:hypothetical protein